MLQVTVGRFQFPIWVRYNKKWKKSLKTYYLIVSIPYMGKVQQHYVVIFIICPRYRVVK